MKDLHFLLPEQQTLNHKFHFNNLKMARQSYIFVFTFVHFLFQSTLSSGGIAAVVVVSLQGENTAHTVAAAVFCPQKRRDFAAAAAVDGRVTRPCCS